MKTKLFFIATLFFSLAVILYSCNKDDGDNTPDENGAPTAVGTPVGISNSASIDATGGSIFSSDGRLELVIPAGALSGATDITIQPITNNTPGGVGFAYRLTPDGQQFSQPITLRYHYDANDVLGTHFSLLGIAYQKADNIWYSFADASLDSAASTASIAVSHFTDFGLYSKVIVTPKEDQIEVSSSIPVNLKAVGLGALIEEEISGDDLTPLGILWDYDEPSQVTWSVNGINGGDPNNGFAYPASNTVTTSYTAPATTSGMSSNPAAVTARVNVPGTGVLYLTSAITVIEGASYVCSVDYIATDAQISYCIENSYTDHGYFVIAVHDNDFTISGIQNFDGTADQVSAFGGGSCTCVANNNGDQLFISGVTGYIENGLINLTINYTSTTPDFTFDCGSNPIPVPSVNNEYTAPFDQFAINTTGSTVVTYGIGTPEVITLTLTPQ